MLHVNICDINDETVVSLGIFYAVKLFGAFGLCAVALGAVTVAAFS